MSQSETGKRQLQARATKQKLFDAAMGLLDEQPFEKITVRDIVARAGVSIGTFYTYYPSKMEVYYETYVLSDEFFKNVMPPKLAAVESAGDRLLLLFDYYAQYASDMTSLKLSKLLYNADNKAFNRPNNQIAQRLDECLRYGVEKGEFDLHGASYRRLTRYFLISLRGLHYDWCTHDGSYDLRLATADYVRILLNTVLARPVDLEKWFATQHESE